MIFRVIWWIVLLAEKEEALELEFKTLLNLGDQSEHTDIDTWMHVLPFALRVAGSAPARLSKIR